MEDAQQQRQWAATEVRAYVLTDHDVNVLRQHHLPLWLQRRALAAGAAGPADAAPRTADATAEPFQLMSGCQCVSVNIPAPPPVEAETGDPAHRRPRGLAVASFADVDKTGKVRNALKFKCPTKQNLVYIAFAAVIGPERDIVLALLSQPCLVISRGEQRLTATEKLGMSPTVARTLWDDINHAIHGVGGSMYQLIDKVSEPKRGGGGARGAGARKRRAKRVASPATSGDCGGGGEGLTELPQASAPNEEPPVGNIYVPLDSDIADGSHHGEATEVTAIEGSVALSPQGHFAATFVPKAAHAPQNPPTQHDGPGSDGPGSGGQHCGWGSGDGISLSAPWQNGSWQQQLSIHSAAARSGSAHAGTGDISGGLLAGACSGGLPPLGGTGPLQNGHTGGAGGHFRITRSLPAPSRGPSSSGTGFDSDRRDDALGYEGRPDDAQHDGAGVHGMGPAFEAWANPHVLTDGGAGAARKARKRPALSAPGHDGDPASHLMHADPAQQLFDPGSSKLFWFPEKPQGQSPHAAFRSSVLRHAAAGGTGGGSSGTLAEDSVPVVSACAGADGGAADDVPPRARNLLDLVPAASESQVDAARAAAAGATASQPVGMQLAAGRGPSFSSATEDLTAQHRGAASGAFIAPSSAPAGESGSIMEVWQRATRSSRQSLPRRLGGSAERSAQTRDPLLHEGSGETHPVWGRRGAPPAHNPAISHGSHAGVSATHGATGAPAMGTPSGEAHQGSGGYADDWRHARLRPAGGPGGRAPAEAWPPVVATVDDAEEEETYLQRLVELQQVLGSGDGCQGPLWHGGSTAAESSLPSAPRPDTEAPARAPSGSPRSLTSNAAARTAGPADARAAAGAVPPGTASAASGPDAARRVARCSSYDMAPATCPSGAVSMDAQHSTPAASGEQLSGPARHSPHLGALWRGGPDDTGDQCPLTSAAMPPLKVARRPPPHFYDSGAYGPHDAVHRARSLTVPQQAGASAQHGHSHQSTPAPALPRTVVRSQSAGMPLAGPKRRAHAAAWHHRGAHDSVWRMETGEVPLAAPDDHSDGGVFQQWGGTGAAGVQGARALGFDHVHLQDPHATHAAHAARPVPRMASGSHGRAMCGGSSSAQELSASAPAAGQSMHVPDMNPAGVDPGAALAMGGAARGWSEMRWGGAGDPGIARSAASLTWPWPVEGAVGGRQQDALPPHVEAMLDLDVDMLPHLDSLDFGLLEE